MNFDLRKFMPLILLGLGAVLVFGMCGTYNSLVPKDEKVKETWSQVENLYQSRMDKMDQMVATVKAAGNYEKSTLEAVVQARASATSVKIDANNLTEENLKNFESKQNSLYSAMKSLLVVNEQYPNLQAVQGYKDLQTVIEGSENRIAVARKDFNAAVKVLNSSIRTFPNNLLANMFGFSQKPYFQAAEGAQKAPNLEEKFK